ncbi:MAG: DEAD/DEAH box helicase family protein, partial [Candidatus Eremiobacteraeota bacterium]|nr:DEAD/DEAH box helicase family protein [Candidatus Eremiobacteraeota bacterium]
MAEVNEKPKVKFKTSSAQTIKPSNHEGLFRDLKVKDPQVQHLWSHQADILRAYQKNHSQSPDVAIEFPTGTGKTLIGLLLAEFRRQALEERVIYLCPTRQLAHQVEQQADGYGIAAKATLAPNYDGINEYGRGSSIAISTYSSLFNTNPRFRDPQVIVLDDAHSSEDYIAKLWSVDIVRSKKQDLYTGVLALITPCLDACTVEGLLTEEPSPQQLSDVELLPIPRFWKYADAFRDLLEGRLRHEDWC